MGFRISSRFVWSDAHVIEEYVDGSLDRNYVHGNMFIDELILFDDGSNVHYYLQDFRYSVYALVDNLGAIEERYRFDPYGKRTVVTDDGSIDEHYGFTGRYHDDSDDTDLIYFRNRWMSGEMGRFVSRDPASYVDGMNLYAGWFVVIKTDPFGKDDNDEEEEDDLESKIKKAKKALEDWAEEACNKKGCCKATSIKYNFLAKNVWKTEKEKDEEKNVTWHTIEQHNYILSGAPDDYDYTECKFQQAVVDIGHYKKPGDEERKWHYIPRIPDWNQDLSPINKDGTGETEDMIQHDNWYTHKPVPFKFLTFGIVCITNAANPVVSDKAKVISISHDYEEEGSKGAVKYQYHSWE